MEKAHRFPMHLIRPQKKEQKSSSFQCPCCHMKKKMEGTWLAKNPFKQGPQIIPVCRSCARKVYWE